MLALWLAGCGAEAEDPEDATTGAASTGPGTTGTLPDDESTTTGAGSSGGGDSDGSETGQLGACEGFVGAVTPEAAETTPHGNLAGERLAFFFTDAVVVPTDVFERAYADFLVLSDMEYTGCPAYTPDPTRLALTFEEPERSQVVSATYSAWDCANALYLGHVQTLAEGEFVTLEFDGMFDPAQVAVDYADLPGVVTAEPITQECHGDDFLPGPRSALHGCPEGDVWHYWWTDAYVGQPDFPITSGAHLVSEPGVAPQVTCSWGEGDEPCPQPSCLELPDRD